jgi:hypothetical protein
MSVENGGQADMPPLMSGDIDFRMAEEREEMGLSAWLKRQERGRY